MNSKNPEVKIKSNQEDSKIEDEEHKKRWILQSGCFFSPFVDWCNSEESENVKFREKIKTEADEFVHQTK